MQRHDTAQLLTGIRAVWHWFDAPEAAVDLWTRALADLEPDRVRAAFDLWISESNKPPTPADLRRLATAGDGPAPLASPPSGSGPRYVVHFRELDPVDGSYRLLPEPLTLTPEAAAELIAGHWAEFHRLHPAPVSIVADSAVPEGLVVAVESGEVVARLELTAPPQGLAIGPLEPEGLFLEVVK